MGIEMLTLIHVALSLAGIGSGFIVVGGMLCGRHLPRPVAVFLLTTALNSATGYLFPINGLTPAHVVGAISLALLAAASIALYRLRLAGRARNAYVVCAMAAQYLNVFVLVVQMFQKIPALAALAPGQSGPVFAAAQGLVLLLFIALGAVAVRDFRAA